MQRALLLNVVVIQSASVLELLAGKDQSLLVRWYTFFVLNLCFDIFNGVARFDFEGYCFSSQCFNKQLNFYFFLGSQQNIACVPNVTRPKKSFA